MTTAEWVVVTLAIANILACVCRGDPMTARTHALGLQMRIIVAGCVAAVAAWLGTRHGDLEAAILIELGVSIWLLHTLPRAEQQVRAVARERTGP